jgi:hypothetical protein
VRPTFDGWSDRLVYLAAEAQLLVVGIITLVGVALYLWAPSLPSVPVVLVDGLAVSLIGGPIPALVGYRGARKLALRAWPVVFHINAIADEREKWFVPPDVWNDRESDVAPNRVNDGSDYEVRQFDWYEAGEEGTLTVSGTWPAEAKDSAMLTSRAYLEDIHDHLLETYERAGKMRGKFSRMALDVQEKLLNYSSEADERGTMLDRSAVREVWSEVEEDLEVEGDELPSLEDHLDEMDGDPQLDATDAGAGEGAAATDGGTDQ